MNDEPSWDLCTHGVAFCLDCAYNAGLEKAALIVERACDDFVARSVFCRNEHEWDYCEPCSAADEIRKAKLL